MEILKGVTIYQLPLSELLFPISMLLLIGVVLMGFGIIAMERREGYWSYSIGRCKNVNLAPLAFQIMHVFVMIK